MNAYYLIVLLAAGSFGGHFVRKRENDEKDACITFDDSVAVHGESFSPKEKDECTTCLCNDGVAVMCSTMECDMPAYNNKCKKLKQLKGCCQFQCQEIESKNDDDDDEPLPDQTSNADNNSSN